jgi:hypothetical protein
VPASASALPEVATAGLVVALGEGEAPGTGVLEACPMAPGDGPLFGVGGVGGVAAGGWPPVVCAGGWPPVVCVGGVGGCPPVCVGGAVDCPLVGVGGVPLV